MSLGKANYVLRALLAKGFVKTENFRKSVNKRGYAYFLTPEGVAAKAELTRHFLTAENRGARCVAVGDCAVADEEFADRTASVVDCDRSDNPLGRPVVSSTL